MGFDCIRGREKSKWGLTGGEKEGAGGVNENKKAMGEG